MPQKTHEKLFSSFDGTKISYRIAGRGKITLLCFNGIGVAKWAWLPFERYFSDKYRIITWDYRGHGLSEDPKDTAQASFNDLVDDATSLIEHLRLRKAYLLGHSSGLQVALEVYRKKPALAKGVISCLGTPGNALDTFMDSFIGRLVFDIGYVLNAVIPETSHWINTNLLNNAATFQIGAALRLVNPAIHGRKEIEKYLGHITKMNFALFNHLIASASKSGAWDVLPKVKRPTLIIASEFDRFVPIDIAKRVHKEITKSELFIIQNGTHAALFEQPDIFNLCVEKFLDSGV